MVTNSQLQISTGVAYPLGVSRPTGAETTNFAIYAPDAERLFLCFFLPDTEELVAKVELVNRTGKVFHIGLSNLPQGWLYAIQAKQKDKEKGKAVDAKYFIDPYATSLNRPVVWEASLYNDNCPRFIPKAGQIPAPFDWQGAEKPKIPKSKTILYETHVKGFTQICEQIPADKRGTYLGLCDPSVLDYLNKLGVTSVQLMPVFSFMAEPRLEELGSPITGVITPLTSSHPTLVMLARMR